MAKETKEENFSVTDMGDIMKRMAEGKPAIGSEEAEVDETDTDVVEDSEVEDALNAGDEDDSDDEEETTDTEEVVEETTPDEVVEEEKPLDDSTKEIERLNKALKGQIAENKRRQKRIDEWKSAAVASSIQVELNDAGFTGSVNLAMRLLKLETVELKEGKIQGIDDQIKELKSEAPELFKAAEEKPKNTVRKPASKVEGSAPAAPAGDPQIAALLASTRRNR